MTPPPGRAEEHALDFDPAEAEREEHPSSFEPPLETGYLRRGHRDHDLPVELGAAPFDPGPDHYDTRRAKRRARRREKAERKRREREERARAAAEAEARERAEAQARARAEAAAEREERRRVAQPPARKRGRLGPETAEREAVQQRDRLSDRRERARRAERARAARARAAAERLQRSERERIATEKAQRAKAQREHRARESAEAKAAEAGAAVPVAPAREPRREPRTQEVPLGRARTQRTQEAPPRLDREPRHVSLKRPTAKVAIALAAVTALATGAGTLLGLPVPVLSDDSGGQSAASLGPDAAALSLLDGGIAPGLTKGPYHPVVGEIGYGERDAKFGAERGGRKHEGLDVFAKPGTPLVAVRDGVVVDRGNENGRYSGGRGNYVVIYSRLDDRSYVYLHMLKPALVEKGAEVRAGQALGQIGCTGSCYGPHLHFEIRNGVQSLRAETKAVDPLPLVKGWPQVPTG